LSDEVSGLIHQGVDTLVSLLEAAEARDLDLHGEATACALHGLRFVHFPIPDRGVPRSRPGFEVLLDELGQDLGSGKAIIIHCRAGIGRTGIVAACLLTRLGVAADEVFTVLSKARGLRMPDTPEQEAWVRQFAAQRVKP
jgi:protein-tyrosine phosphatase